MKIIEKSPHMPEAINLMDELSRSLESITGDNGRSSFDPNDVCGLKAVFAIAYDQNEEAIGCGVIRPIDDKIAEVKRMYAKTKENGVGTKILCYLEKRAQEMGYSVLCLETRLINERAVFFYEGRGYHRIMNYGKYANRPEAVCLEKNIVTNIMEIK